MENTLLDNATQQIVYELLKIVLSVTGLFIAYYVKKWLATSEFAKKYELDQIITERTIDNSVTYAEAKGRELGYKGIKKKELALKYLDIIDPKLINKYGEKIDLMVDRKVAQKYLK